MESFNNISLYIKRADLYCTKQFIIDTFATNNVGIVKDVKFINKTDGFNREYNGVIVIFERWFMNSKVQKMMNDMGSSADGTTKFIYDYSGHYWFINVHKQVLPETEEYFTVDSTLPDKQRINALENLVKTMAAQMHYMQIRQERSEKQIMNYEHNDTLHHIYNIDLKGQLEDKDIKLVLQQRAYEKMLKKSQDEVTVLKERLYLLERLEAQENSYYPNISKMTIDELSS